MKLRKGDRVRVTATVKWDPEPGEDRLTLQVDGAYESTRVDGKDVEFVHHSFAPGDLVETPDDPNSDTSGTMIATVIAVHKGIAWLEPDDGTGEMVERALRDLSPAEQPEAQKEQAA